MSYLQRPRPERQEMRAKEMRAWCSRVTAANRYQSVRCEMYKVGCQAHEDHTRHKLLNTGLVIVLVKL